MGGGKGLYLGVQVPHLSDLPRAACMHPVEVNLKKKILIFRHMFAVFISVNMP